MVSEFSTEHKGIVFATYLKFPTCTQVSIAGNAIQVYTKKNSDLQLLCLLLLVRLEKHKSTWRRKKQKKRTNQEPFKKFYACLLEIQTESIIQVFFIYKMTSTKDLCEAQLGPSGF